VEIYNMLSSIKLETLLFMMALTRESQKKKAISRYLTELRKIRTILKGDDLKRAGIKPGPVYSKILKELLEEKLKGGLKFREDEERFVMSKAKQQR
jgi:tRNA nucleotidyltransferase (CCA-adding enzyme)